MVDVEQIKLLIQEAEENDGELWWKTRESGIVEALKWVIGEGERPSFIEE